MKQFHLRREGTRGSGGFTLIELLVAMAIIGILTGIVLAAASGIQKTALRNRATAEIQAIGTGLEAYKADNGTYPIINNFTTTDYKGAGSPAVADGPYQLSAQALYQALCSKVYSYDNKEELSTEAPATGHIYLPNLKVSQLGNTKPGSGGKTYLQDPFGFSYGYNTGDTVNPQVNPPISGTGLYDLWSTGGITAATTQNPNWEQSWIKSWK